jgi:hypothetical protein
MANNIRRIGDKTPAGLGRLFYIGQHYLEQPIESDQVTVLDEIHSGGQGWNELEGMVQTCSLDTEGEVSQHGLQYVHEITGFFDGENEQVAATFKSMSNRRFAVVVEDFTRRKRLIGQDAGLLFTYKWVSGKKGGERKGYAWSFKTRSLQPPLFYNGSLVLLADSGPVVLPPPGGGNSSGFVELRSSAGRLLARVPAGQTVVIKSGFKLSFQIQ